MGALQSPSTARARSLRRLPTDAEARLWRHLRNRQVLGLKFVRQLPIGPYFADFACREADLVIELDGGQHIAASAYDEKRTAVLAEHGFAVLRFWNNDVLTNTNGVILALTEHIEKRAHRLRYERAASSDREGLK